MVGKYILLIILPLFFLGFIKDSKKSKVYWHERSVITWDDFREVENLEGNEAALISFSIPSNGLFYERNNLVCEVIAEMNTNRSVYIKNDVSLHLLIHEQGHFDIVEIYARKTRKAYSERIFEKHLLNKEFINISNSIFKQCNSFQDLYDKETNHSENKEIQEEWDIRIAEELEELEDYKDIRVVCRVE